MDNIIKFIDMGKNVILFTSLGPTSLVIMDLLNKKNILNKCIIIFIDTLYHFNETYQFLDEIQKYFKITINIEKPLNITNVEEFEKKYGKELWKRNPSKYAYYSKIIGDCC